MLNYMDQSSTRGGTYCERHFAHICLLVAQHYPSSYLAATLQIAQRRARLVRGTRLNRNRRDLAREGDSMLLLTLIFSNFH
jgi:hypothetical protein